MKIKLDQIKNNPYRDMKLDPLRDKSVKEMEQSIDTLGFWGGLAARKSEDGYELAFGHHRLQALRNLGWTEADITEVEYDDDKMVKAMTKENATQRGTESGGNVDAVSGIIRRIGYLMLTADEGRMNSYNLFKSKSAQTQARNNFIKGKGIGWAVIHDYEPSLSCSSIQGALASLNAFGYMRTISEMVQEQIEREAVAAQAVALKATKAKKAAAEKHAAALAQAQENAEKAVTESDPEVNFDINVEYIFNNDSHTAAFRTVVISKDGKKYLPVESHVAMAKQIVKEANEDKAVKFITAKYIGSSVKKVLHQAMTYNKIEQEKLEQQMIDERALSGWKALVAGVNKAATGAAKLTDALDEGARLTSLAKAQAYLRIDCKALIGALETLEAQLNETDTVISTQ